MTNTLPRRTVTDIWDEGYLAYHKNERRSSRRRKPALRCPYPYTDDPADNLLGIIWNYGYWAAGKGVSVENGRQRAWERFGDAMVTSRVIYLLMCRAHGLPPSVPESVPVFKQWDPTKLITLTPKEDT